MATKEVAWDLLTREFDALVRGEVGSGEGAPVLEPAVAAQIRAVLLHKHRSYGVAALVQMAFKLADESVDATQRQPGSRGLQGVAGRLSKRLVAMHIPTVEDAFQNIGKNSENLCRGNFAEFDSLLRWVQTADRGYLRSAFRLACSITASMARPIDPMPELRMERLTFARLTKLYRTLLASGSQGVLEQQVVASLLDAVVQQNCPSNYRVDTKRTTASDQSSGAAGDIQVCTGVRVLEAIEVTAASWQGKLAGASRKIREHDLSRMHIIAPLPDAPELVQSQLDSLSDDVSVLDMASLIAVCVASLIKRYRLHALTRLYELLDRVEGSVELTNRFVGALSDAGLTAVSAEQSE